MGISMIQTRGKAGCNNCGGVNTYWHECDQNHDGCMVLLCAGCNHRDYDCGTV